MTVNKCYTMQTPLGTVGVHAHEDIPIYISLTGGTESGMRPDYDPPPQVEAIMTALADYFDGRDVPKEFAEALLGLHNPTPFEDAVLREVIRIPRGDTRSYGEIAELAGSPRAARAVGNIMHGNPYPIIIPCHRVIRADGEIGGYGGAEHLKAWLLEFEGASTAPLQATDNNSPEKAKII